MAPAPAQRAAHACPSASAVCAKSASSWREHGMEHFAVCNGPGAAAGQCPQPPRAVVPSSLLANWSGGHLAPAGLSTFSEGNNLCCPSDIPHTRCVRVSGHVSLLVASTQLRLLDYTLPSTLSAGRNICFCFLAQLLPNIHINNREHCSIFFS